jgi:hypothetical protein
MKRKYRPAQLMARQRSKKLPAWRRKEIAQKAAASRWAFHRNDLAV